MPGLTAFRALLGNSDEALVGVMRYCADEALDSVCTTSLDGLIGVLWTILVEGRAPARAQHLALDVLWLQALAAWRPPTVRFPARCAPKSKPALYQHLAPKPCGAAVH